MLTEKTNRLVGLIQKNRGIDCPQDIRNILLTEVVKNRGSRVKLASNIDLILPLVLNAYALDLGGFQASMLVTLVNLIVESESNLLPPNLRELANKVKCGLSTLERHVAQLKDLGFLEVDKALDDRGFARNIYRFGGLKDKLQSLGVDV